MGNYVFTTKTLVDVVTPGERELKDIGGDVIPALTEAGQAQVYDFSGNDIPGLVEPERGYWRDVGSLDAYYEANMDLIAPVPLFSLYNPQWPIYSIQLPLPPAKLSNGGDGSPARREQQPPVRRLHRVGRARRALDHRTRCLHRRGRAWSPSRSCSPACASKPARASITASSTRT